jgi:hypothetical protein
VTRWWARNPELAVFAITALLIVLEQVRDRPVQVLRLVSFP